MSAIGTKRTTDDVRSSVANGGNPDMARAVHFDSVDTAKTSISLSPHRWQDLETFSFGDGPDLANRLCLLSAEVGKFMVVLDGQGAPKAVLKTIELTKRRFDEVDEACSYSSVGPGRLRRSR